jgi:hypothetical protein
MVQLIFVALLAFTARADLFSSDDVLKSRIPELVEKLKGLDVKPTAAFEEKFNAGIKSLETALEEEKEFCSGELADGKGKVIPASQKKLCFRQLKGHYLDAMDVIFGLKKRYLDAIHSQQIEQLNQLQKQQRADIEKRF